MDKHLEFYFSSKNNRRILQQNKIINRRNFIIDKNLNKKLVSGQVPLNSTNFKIKRKVNKRISLAEQSRSKTLKSGHDIGRKVEKEDFKRFLEEQKEKVRRGRKENEGK